MVNRSVQAKDFKRKNRGKSKRRAKKVLNTGSNYMNYSSGPVKDEIKLYHQRTGNSIYRDRKGSIHVNQTQTAEFLAFWEARFPSMKYSKRELKERGLPDEYGIITANLVPRGEALRKQAEIMKETDMTMHYRFKRGPALNVDIFFNAKRTKFYAVETDLDRHRIRTSEIYGYAEIIKAQYPNLMWKHIVKLE